jgi:hypothetical protein
MYKTFIVILGIVIIALVLKDLPQKKIDETVKDLEEPELYKSGDIVTVDNTQLIEIDEEKSLIIYELKHIKSDCVYNAVVLSRTITDGDTLVTVDEGVGTTPIRNCFVMAPQ